MILIRRDNEIYGPFEKELVKDMLIEQRVTLDDEARDERCAHWDSLRHVLYPQKRGVKSKESDRKEIPLNAQPIPKPTPINCVDPKDAWRTPHLAEEATRKYETIPLGKRIKEASTLLFGSVIFLLIPVIGWILAIFCLFGAFTTLLNPRKQISPAKGFFYEIEHELAVSGYQDPFQRNLGIFLSVLGFLSWAASWTQRDATGDDQIGFIIPLFAGVILQFAALKCIHRYLNPKNQRGFRWKQ